VARADLTANERAAHIREHERIMSERLKEVLETGDKPRPVDEVSKGGRGRKGGNSAIARDLGIGEATVRRAKTAGKVSEAAMRQAALPHNRPRDRGQARRVRDVLPVFALQLALRATLLNRGA
jgi:hypothetical protein